MAGQDIIGCISASKEKLEGILSLENQLIADLPAAYLEAYEFLAIGKVSYFIKKVILSPCYGLGNES